MLPNQCDLDRAANIACHECRSHKRETWQRRRGRNPIGYLFSVTLASSVTAGRQEKNVRSNRLKTYAASGLVLAALAAGSYGVVTLSSGTTVVTHAAPSAATHVVPPAVAPPTTATAPTPTTSAAPSHLTPSAPP